MKLFGLNKKTENTTPRKGDRRSGTDKNYSGAERRQGDRRGLKVGIKFKLSRALGPVEDWLEEHFPGEHLLSIENISDDFEEKEVRVLLSTTAQRDAFAAFLRAYSKSR